MSVDCEVCNMTICATEDHEEAAEFCTRCAYEMLGFVQAIEVAGFVNVEVDSTQKAWVVIGKDVGPAIVDERFGPWSLGEAYRRAKEFAEYEDDDCLRPAKATDR